MSLNLSFDLLIREVKQADQGTPKNVAVSPLSLDAAVAMLGAGCSQPCLNELLRFAKCETVEELKTKFTNALDVVTCSGEHCPTISFANAAWIDECYSFQPEYEECLKNIFKIEDSTTCDFITKVDEAVKDINCWVETQTNGLIKSIVTRNQFNEHIRTAVIMTNALYFKGTWLIPFVPQFTEDRDFYLINGDKISDVPFMTGATHRRYGSFHEYKVLELPYQGGGDQRKEFCMQIILPHEKDGLQSVLEKLNQSPSWNMNFYLQTTYLSNLWIPKFKFSTTLGKDDLRIPFLEGEKEFKVSKMLQNSGPFVIPSICQKVAVEVDEVGTEAAAVTFYDVVAPTYSPGLVRPPPETFVADHPFLFVIRENSSGLVLFLGTVLNPLEK